MSDPTFVPTGRIADRYLLEYELGRGGMATVYRARDERLGRAVALKVMHPSLPASSRERFRREAEIVASLKHRNILEIHDVGEDPARGPWLVTELVEGESLRALIQRVGPMSAAAAATVGWELAQALAEAHARGVIHRDVKPENVLLSKDGRLKLADFGIAALHDQARLTSTGGVTGSLAYMAPERLDDGSFSPASDVFAVGVIVFELCAGQTPFAGGGAAQLAAAVLTRDAPPLEEGAPAVPPALSALVARCLARDPAARFADGAALARALEEFVRAELGSPSEASAALLRDPLAENQRLRDRDFARLLEQAQALFASGQAARAGRLLDAALALRPGAEEVRALVLFAARRGKQLRRALWAAGGACALAAVAGVLVWSAGGPDDSPSTLPTDPPPSAVIAISPRQASQDAGTAVAQQKSAWAEPEPTPRRAQPTPDPTARVEPRKKGAAPVVARTEDPARTAPEEASRAEVQVSGTLLLSSRPWAEVFVDGKSVGYTPAVRSLPLPPGEHVLRLVSPHCEVHEETLRVRPGEAVSRDVSLILRKAALVIRAPAGSKVFVDGMEVGTAPLPAPLSREHGKHAVSAILPDGKRVSREVTLVAGNEHQVELEGGG